MTDQRVIFYDALKNLDDIAYLTYYLKYQLAPVMMGYKSAITFSSGIRGKRKISKIKTLGVISKLGLQGMVLRETPTCHIVLAYSPYALEELLIETKKRKLLEQLGYPLHSIYALLGYLRKRYTICHCPAELGIFLGFPVEDVRDYMGGSHKKCLLCGYWQVYNNVEEAKRIFKTYDEAKEKMLVTLLDEIKKIDNKN